MTAWERFLKEKDACEDGYSYAKKMSPQEFWDKCERSDWMFWVLRKSKIEIEKEVYIKISIDCAESVSHLCKEVKEAQEAIGAAKNWLENQTKENFIFAHNAGYKAAERAYKVSGVVYSASKAASSAAYCIKDRHLPYATYSAFYSNDANYNPKKYADIVRKYIPVLNLNFLKGDV